MTTEWIWLAAWVRALTWPLAVALAAASASTLSDFPPRWRRSCRLGRFTSTTSRPAAARYRASPAP